MCYRKCLIIMPVVPNSMEVMETDLHFLCGNRIKYVTVQPVCSRLGALMGPT